MKPRSSDDCVRALNSCDEITTRLLKVPGGINDLYARVKAEAGTIRAQNYDGSRDNRKDEYGYLPDWSDPTGDTAADGRARELMDRLLDSVHQAHAALSRLDNMRHEYLRDRPVQAVNENLGPGAMWCESCWRDNKHCEPTSERYKKLCRWCGDMTNDLGERPALELVQQRHRGQRISQAEVVKYHPNARMAG